jgi:hypothetical protein
LHRIRTAKYAQILQISFVKQATNGQPALRFRARAKVEAFIALKA